MSIKQGNSLSRLLFLLVKDEMIKNTKKRTKNLQTKIGCYYMNVVRLEGLLYADDIVIVAENHIIIEEMFGI